MKLSRADLRNIISEQQRRLIKEDQGMVSNKELSHALLACFAEWCTHSGGGESFEQFESAVLRKLKMFDPGVSMMDLELACSDILHKKESNFRDGLG